MNENYIKILRLLSTSVPKDKYLVLGSGATLAYTSTIGYERKMHDLDIIIDRTFAFCIQKRLLKLGYTQSTFINKRMPFYRLLLRHQAMYVRLLKNDICVDLLMTDFIMHESQVRLALYPDISVSIPSATLIRTSHNGAPLTTLDVHVLWAINHVLHSTLGRVMTYKAKQRTEDLSALKKMVDINRARHELSQCRFGFMNIWFRVPRFIYP